MKSKKIILNPSGIVLFLLFSSLTILATAQEIENEDEFNLDALPDTLSFFSPETVFVNSIDSLQQQIIDTLQNPLCYLLNTKSSGTGYQCLLALQTKHGFLLFNPFDNSSAYAVAHNLHFERIDFDSKGSLELLLTWEFYAGHSGWTNAVHTHEAGMQLWNLDKLVRYADFKTYYNFEHWWTNYEENPNDSIPFDELEVLDSGGESECERIDFEIRKKKIFVSLPYRCNDDSEEAFLSELFEFRLQKKNLIRK